jgi:type II secretory pathway component PulJ
MSVTRRRRQRGFGTMEALVASVVTLVVALAILGFFDSQQRAYATMSTYAASQTVTRTVVDLMGRELRMASYDPLDTALADYPGPTCPGVDQGIVIARPQFIQMQQDLNGSGAIDAASEDVTYLLSGNQIRRVDNGVGGSTATLVENVPAGGFVIRYFDDQNPPVEIVPAGSPAQLTAAQRACVQKVQIEIHAQIDNPHPSQPDLDSVVRSGIAIRNRSIAKF